MIIVLNALCWNEIFNILCALCWSDVGGGGGGGDSEVFPIIDLNLHPGQLLIFV